MEKKTYIFTASTIKGIIYKTYFFTSTKTGLYTKPASVPRQKKGLQKLTSLPQLKRDYILKLHLYVNLKGSYTKVTSVRQLKRDYIPKLHLYVK